MAQLPTVKGAKDLDRPPVAPTRSSNSRVTSPMCRGRISRTASVIQRSSVATSIRIGARSSLQGRRVAHSRHTFLDQRDRAHRRARSAPDFEGEAQEREAVDAGLAQLLEHQVLDDVDPGARQKDQVTG